MFQDRYANRPNCHDVCTVEGVLTIHTSWWMTILSPFLRLSGALVPYAAKDIKVIVDIKSNPENDKLEFKRTFYYQTRKPYTFVSTWVPQGGSKVIEFMRWGLGWEMKCHFQDNRVHLDHEAFVWKMGRLSIPFPIHLMLGTPYAYEEAVDDQNFSMYFEIIHPWFGNVFGYKGDFSIIKKVSHD